MGYDVYLIINKKGPSSDIAINRYFCNVPTELVSKLKVDRHFSTYMKRKKSTFRFAQVNETEVYLLLESIDTKKSFGHDKVHLLLLS